VKEIGGYFELELSSNGSVFHDDAFTLNSARNAFYWLLKTRKITKVFMPAFMCRVMLDPVLALGVDYEFYGITCDYELAKTLSLKDSEIVLYPNYFGLKGDYADTLANIYGEERVVYDCSQSFYYRPSNNCACIYSPRKFFGVADGAFMCDPFGVYDEGELVPRSSYHRMTPLLGRVDEAAFRHYDSMKENEGGLRYESLGRMSPLSYKILDSIDYERARKVRVENYSALHSELRLLNEFTVGVTSSFAYPFRTKNAAGLRQFLIGRGIYVAYYWPEVCCDSSNLYPTDVFDETLFLPIDQRYESADMLDVANLIKSWAREV